MSFTLNLRRADSSEDTAERSLVRVVAEVIVRVLLCTTMVLTVSSSVVLE